MQVKADQKGLSAGLRASIKGKVSDQLSKAEESELADVSLAHGSGALHGTVQAALIGCRVSSWACGRHGTRG